MTAGEEALKTCSLDGHLHPLFASVPGLEGEGGEGDSNETIELRTQGVVLTSCRRQAVSARALPSITRYISIHRSTFKKKSLLVCYMCLTMMENT
jgi:hypothetical protein